MPTKSTVRDSPRRVADVDESPAKKAQRTARWARIMTKWLITHSSKDRVKWQVVSFNGKGGNESKGIVDMIAIRKNHRPSKNVPVGDLFEIVLIQVKGGSARFPSEADIDRLKAVAKHHNADKVVIAEWKKGKALQCYLPDDLKTPIAASEIFGSMPTQAQLDSVTNARIGDGGS